MLQFGIPGSVGLFNKCISMFQVEGQTDNSTQQGFRCPLQVILLPGRHVLQGRHGQVSAGQPLEPLLGQYPLQQHTPHQC